MRVDIEPLGQGVCTRRTTEAVGLPMLQCGEMVYDGLQRGVHPWKSSHDSFYPLGSDIMTYDLVVVGYESLEVTWLCQSR